MPIFVQNYNWKQNTEKIHISIPLKDVPKSKLHLFTSKKYVKLNFPPYIFELVLNGVVQSNKSKCVVKEGEVILELIKEETGLWPQLLEIVDQKKLVDVRNEIIDEGQKIATEEEQDREKLKSKQTHFLRDCQMLVNKEEMHTIESLKEKQRANAIRELTNWKKEETYQSDTSRRKKLEAEKEAQFPVPVPFPRPEGAITFSFTPRVLPTPKRASKSLEEEEWLKKQAEAMRCSGFVAADLSEEEKDPLWLLNKGIHFFKNMNYQGALNAFEYATKISPKMPVLYVRLAETFMKIGQYPKAIDRATLAIELLTPVVQQNQALRAEAFQIRAKAYESIGELRRSAADYKESEMILKKNCNGK